MVRHLLGEQGNRLIGVEKGVSEYKKKVDSTYRPGYGTVLFFEDHKVLEEWGQKMPNYSKACPLPSPLIDWTDTFSNSTPGPRTRLVSFSTLSGPLCPRRD